MIKIPMIGAQLLHGLTGRAELVKLRARPMMNDQMVIQSSSHCVHMLEHADAAAMVKLQW